MIDAPTHVVITDLDGTLLDHHTYAWHAAEPALQALRDRRIPVILNSSKTRAEISALRAEMANNDPYIVENGAAVVLPKDYFEPGPEQLMPFAEPRSVLLEMLADLRKQGFLFRSFGMMSAEELAERTGLPEAAATLAKRRDATEPLIWQGDEHGLAAFEDALAQHQLRLVKGGRFHHVMGFFDKADAMQYLLQRYRKLPEQKTGAGSGADIKTIALGDSPNDLRMLEQADIAVIIRSENSAAMDLPGHPNVIRSQQSGPAGWNDCILEILKGLS